MTRYGTPRLIAVIVLSLGAIGCGGSVQTRVHSRRPETAFHTAYIVDNGYSIVVGYDAELLPDSSAPSAEGDRTKVEPIGKIPLHIEKALRSHGIESTIGGPRSIPPNVDLVVRYQDEWQWDFKKYLKRLIVRFYDGKSRKELVDGKLVPSRLPFQSFPTAKGEVPKIVSMMIRDIK